MVTVADILALPAFHRWKVLAGEPNGLNRPVVNIGIMDTAIGADSYADYKPGELILTNLGFAAGEVASGEASLCGMVSRDLAALAVRNAYDFPISDTVLQASNASGTPLIVYDGEYVEQIIFQGMKLIERDRSDSDISKLIDGLLRSRTPESIREVFYEALRCSGATIQCAALRPIGGDEASLYAHIDELSDVAASIKRDWRRIETAGVFRYHDCAIVTVTYNRPPEAFSIQSDSEFVQLLRQHGRFMGGISEEVPLGQGDLAVREAFGALEVASADGERIVRWAGMRAGAFRNAASQDRLITSTCELYQQMLADHDEQHDADLLATARAFADQCGDVRATAEVLFQHPNTVRYRLRKLKSIFSMEDATDRELARFLMLVFLA